MRYIPVFSPDGMRTGVQPERPGIHRLRYFRAVKPFGFLTYHACVAAKNPALLKAYWSKQLFTGCGQPPQEVTDSAAVKKLVADTPGMIGYIDREALDATVRVLLVVR